MASTIVAAFMYFGLKTLYDASQIKDGEPSGIEVLTLALALAQHTGIHYFFVPINTTFTTTAGRERRSREGR